MTVSQLAKKVRQDHGYRIGDSTIRDVEKVSKITNPGVKTVEMIARGLGLDPLEVISLSFDVRRNSKPDTPRANSHN